MTLPTSPADKNWPKGPNFLLIVIGFAAAILVVLVAAVLIVRNRAQKMVPVKTDPTPSQSMLRNPTPAGQGTASVLTRPQGRGNQLGDGRQPSREATRLTA